MVVRFSIFDVDQVKGTGAKVKCSIWLNGYPPLLTKYGPV